MSIPKEPRQLMINLMYLVLTAMLALNVSAKIINAFFNIEKGIAASYKVTDASNTLLMGAIEKSAETADKYAPLVEASKQVKTIVSGFTAYVEEIRTSLVPDGKFYPETDKHHAGQPMNYKNKDVTTRLLVNQGKGEELKAKIIETRKQLMDIIAGLKAKNIEGTDFTEGRIKELESAMTLEIDDTEWQNHGSPSWSAFNFNQMPVASLWPMLTKFKTDAKSSEAAILNFLASQIGATSFKVDAFVPISSPVKSYVLEGEKFQTELAVGASSQSFFEGVNIAVNGASQRVVDGKAMFETTASGVGEKSYRVSIRVRNPATGKDLSADKEFKYEVGRGSVSMELVDMNAVYIGVDNRLSVTAGGASSNKISVSASGGGMSLTPSGAQGNYVIRATTPAADASIVVTVEGKSYTKKVKVKRIPDPAPMLGAKHKGGRMGSGEFKAQGGIAAVLDNFDFDAKCTIQSFGMFRIPKRSDPVPAKNEGASFGGSCTSLIQAAVPGDVYLFEEIKARCPGDAAGRDLGSISFTIK